MNREEWLNTLRQRLEPHFALAGHTLPPNIRCSCGFPKGSREAIGQCWPVEVSKDTTTEIFVSPVLADPLQVGATLVHELCHAATPGAKHKGAFKRCALAVGLTGKMTSTTATPELDALLQELMLEPYPHAELTPTERVKAGTRLLKVACPSCGYTVRTTQKWLDVGLPVCPCGEEMDAV